MATKFQRANQKRRLEANGLPPEEMVPTMPLTSLTMGSGQWGGLLSGLRQWCSQGIGSPNHHPEQDAGVHMEFDTDIVDALVYIVGRWMGLDAEQLRHSPGLRTLVSRNIEWFRSSPDWLKLAGLILAKKLNRTLDCPTRSPSDTQRMLLDRMMSQMGQTNSEDIAPVTTAAEEINPTAPVDREAPIDCAAPPPPELIATAVEAETPTEPPVKKRRTTPRVKASVPSAVESPEKNKPPKKERKTKSSPKKPVTMDPSDTPPQAVRKHDKPPRIGKKRSVSKLQALLADTPSNAVFVDATQMDAIVTTHTQSLDEKTQAPSPSDPST